MTSPIDRKLLDKYKKDKVVSVSFKCDLEDIWNRIKKLFKKGGKNA
jgi:hypothetical protein